MSFLLRFLISRFDLSDKKVNLVDFLTVIAVGAVVLMVRHVLVPVSHFEFSFILFFTFVGAFLLSLERKVEVNMKEGKIDYDT